MPATGKDIIKIDALQIRESLIAFKNQVPMQGLHSAASLDCFARQIFDSIKRVNGIIEIRNAIQPVSCLDISAKGFNPIKTAIYHKQQGNKDEACWLAFLATHFGEDENKTGWSHVHNLYSALGNAVYWDWDRISKDVNGFRIWLHRNKDILQRRGRFGNHRKYESLHDEHTGKTIATYIDWIGDGHKHSKLITDATARVGNNPHLLFDALYKSMDRVFRFGRTARFDYLCLLGKLGLADIEPGHPYLYEATGPLIGAKLLFGIDNTSNLNNRLRRLGVYLDLYFGMQIMEDAICNWHKSPHEFISFLPATY